MSTIQKNGVYNPEKHDLTVAVILVIASAIVTLGGITATIFVSSWKISLATLIAFGALICAGYYWLTIIHDRADQLRTQLRDEHMAPYYAAMGGKKAA